MKKGQTVPVLSAQREKNTWQWEYPESDKKIKIACYW
jgi:hypothetical protein